MLDVRFAYEDIQQARRAYYDSISHIDAMVGRILETLEAVGHAQNTAIIFISDHGEMLGERGMWFKKQFFEPALRIPLLMKLPGQAARCFATPLSLGDLLPTFKGIAEGPGWHSPIEPLDGAELTALIDADSTPGRPIFAKYLAEATTAPILPILSGYGPAGPPRWIHSEDATDDVL